MQAQIWQWIILFFYVRNLSSIESILELIFFKQTLFQFRIERIFRNYMTNYFLTIF